MPDSVGDNSAPNTNYPSTSAQTASTSKGIAEQIVRVKMSNGDTIFIKRIPAKAQLNRNAFQDFDEFKNFDEFKDFNTASEFKFDNDGTLTIDAEGKIIISDLKKPQRLRTDFKEPQRLITDKMVHEVASTVFWVSLIYFCFRRIEKS